MPTKWTKPLLVGALSYPRVLSDRVDLGYGGKEKPQYRDL